VPSADPFRPIRFLGPLFRTRHPPSNQMAAARSSWRPIWIAVLGSADGRMPRPPSS